MIIERDKQITNEGYGQGRSQQMTLDQNSLAHIMSVLTNLYSNPQLAVIREYTTNASDSHIAAGKADKPIEITLPSAFEPVFIVKDEGVGLSEEEVFEIFGAYGRSTKRETNDQVGALGLGCKSALTYTSQFTLTATKDGIRNVYSVHLDEFGVGKITELGSTEVSEPNGVEVRIPVKDVSSFINNAREFYRLYRFPVKFTNATDAFMRSLEINEKIQLDDDMFLCNLNTGYWTHYIVMGGVAYRIDVHQARVGNFNAANLVVEAPIGAVHFTPNREDLQYTETTVNFIREAFKRAQKLYSAKVFEAADKEETLSKAYTLIRKHSSNLSGDYSYKGVELMKGGSVQYKTTAYMKGVFGLERRWNGRGNGPSLMDTSINLFQLEQNTLLVKTDVKLSVYHRGLLRTYAIEKGHQQVIVRLTTEGEYDDALKPHLPEEVDFETIKKAALKIRREERRANGASGTTGDAKNPAYPSMFSKQRSLVDPEKTLVYATIQSELWQGTVNDLLTNENRDDYQFIYVAPNRINRFDKLYPDAVKVEDWISEKTAERFDELSDDLVSDYSLWHLIRNERPEIASAIDEVLRKLGGSWDLKNRVKGFEDSELRHFIVYGNERRWSAPPDYVQRALANEELMKLSSKYVSVVQPAKEEFLKLYESVTTKYPLLFQLVNNSEFWINYANQERGK